tara:strand:+ start:213 stop:653 length:441 start_codon:yes stop_codon:yes gene_type:complete
MELVSIPEAKINDVWPLVEKPIQEALSYSGNHQDSQFVYDTLRNKKFQLWIIWDQSKPTTQEKYHGLVITEVIQRKLKKVCHIYMMTGKQRQKWQHLIKVIEDFARDQKCDLMELIARAGWQVILSKYKYQRTHVVLEKPINNKEK